MKCGTTQSEDKLFSPRGDSELRDRKGASRRGARHSNILKLLIITATLLKLNQVTRTTVVHTWYLLVRYAFLLGNKATFYVKKWSMSRP